MKFTERDIEKVKVSVPINVVYIQIEILLKDFHRGTSGRNLTSVHKSYKHGSRIKFFFWCLLLERLFAALCCVHKSFKGKARKKQAFFAERTMKWKHVEGLVHILRNGLTISRPTPSPLPLTFSFFSSLTRQPTYPKSILLYMNEPKTQKQHMRESKKVHETDGLNFLWQIFMLKTLR